MSMAKLEDCAEIVWDETLDTEQERDRAEKPWVLGFQAVSDDFRGCVGVFLGKTT